jgi:hypothetical protein
MARRAPGWDGLRSSASFAAVAASVRLYFSRNSSTRPHARVEVVGIGGDGLVEGLQRVLEELRIVRAQGPAGPCHRRQLLGGERGRLVVGLDEPVEAAHGFLALAAGEAEAREVHLRGQRIRGAARDGLLEGGLRLRVAAPRGQDLAERVEQLGERGLAAWNFFASSSASA